MLRSSGIKTITRNIRTKDEKYLQPKPTLQRRPGDWYGGPTGDRNWNHLINTKKDIHSLIKLERLEFPTDRAKNCKDYFNKLIEIARNKVSFEYILNEIIAEFFFYQNFRSVNQIIHQNN